MAITQTRHGLSGRRYGSFAGKTSSAIIVEIEAGSFLFTGQSADLEVANPFALSLIAEVGEFFLTGTNVEGLRKKWPGNASFARKGPGNATFARRGPGNATFARKTSDN